MSVLRWSRRKIDSFTTGLTVKCSGFGFGFTTTIEEGGDGHRYGVTLVLSCSLSFKTTIEGRLIVLRWSGRKIDNPKMEYKEDW